MVKGDLAKLQPSERVQYYKSVCESLNLNPFTKPFDYISLNGKLTLYAKKDATDQLRNNNNISITITSREKFDDLYVVSALGKTPDGRTDEAIGAVNIKGLAGDNLANALMKAETKAKRRVTLSICGLGFTDETEIETIPTAKITQVDDRTGEILEPVKQLPPAKPQSQKTAIPEVEHDVVEPITNVQFETIKELAAKHFTDKIIEMNAFIANVVGREVTAIKSISAHEANRVVDALTALGAN